MSEQATIPISAVAGNLRAMPAPLADGALVDRLHRPFADVRISVTDRCNFRCGYCMPTHLFGADHSFLPRSEILSFEEIVRTVKILMPLGLRKIRLTGGEPLLRHDFPQLMERLYRLIEGQDIDLTLTTNGSMLAKQLPQLMAAGLSRITVSLDAIDPKIFAQMNALDFPLERVLEGIHSALAQGISTKINMVVLRGKNEQQIVPLIDYFRTHFSGESMPILRFIEFMDVGNSNDWQSAKVFSAQEILATIRTRYALEPLPAHYRGEVAQRYRLSEGGEIGIIASVSAPFCRDCTRLRLSADGRFYTCLFANVGYDWRSLLRTGATDHDLQGSLRALWQDRRDRYSELRAQQPLTHKIEMSYIGG